LVAVGFAHVGNYWYFCRRNITYTTHDMLDKKLRRQLADIAPAAARYDKPYFDHSIIGVTDTGRLVYHYDKMIDEYMEDEHDNLSSMTSEEIDQAAMDAMEWIDYNTIRSTPYAGTNAPIIVAPDVTSAHENDYVNMITGERISSDEWTLLDDLLKEKTDER